MNYRTVDETSHFKFEDAYIADVQVTKGIFHLILDNVTILPENSCNRDIRTMRTNQMMFKLEEAEVVSLVEEGYKVYDANGNLSQTYEDQEIAKEQYTSVIKEFADGSIYSLEKQEELYTFLIDAPNERTYNLQVKASHDVEEWDRFMSKEE